MKTQAEILTSMLTNLPEKYDRTEGSVIYDILAPISIALYDAYQQSELNLSRAFVQTATGEDLDNKVAEIGMARMIEETDEELRARYFDVVNAPAMSGNAKDIEKIALEIPGVTRVRCVPLWNGSNTSTIGSDLGYCTVAYQGSSMIEEDLPIKANAGIQYNIIEASDLVINVSVSISVDGNIDTIKESIIKALGNYIDSCDGLVSYGLVGKTILDINGVLDYSNLTINNGANNITVPKLKFAKLGEVTVND